MIKLSSESYTIRGVQLKEFWTKLDAITCGQTINPEFSYTTPHWGSFDNIFGGRKLGNTFSVYLYRPITESFRTEILAKGTVKTFEKGLKVEVRYEIPLWSLLAFVFIGGGTFLWLWLSFSQGSSLTVIGVLTLLYILVLNSNHKAVKREIRSQFVKFEDSEKIVSVT